MQYTARPSALVGRQLARSFLCTPSSITRKYLFCLASCKNQQETLGGVVGGCERGGFTNRLLDPWIIHNTSVNARDRN